MIILAQIIAIFAILAYSLVPHQKTKKKVLIFKIISNSLYTIQYLILGALSAAGTNFITVLQSLIFYKYAKENRKVPVLWGITLAVFIVIIGVLTYSNIGSLIPIILSLLTSYGVWQDNLKVYRIICAFSLFVWIFYNFYLSAYIAGAGNIFQFISAMIAIYNLDIKNKVKKLSENNAH